VRFFDRPEIVDFWGLGGPGWPGNLPKRWGASPPTFLEGFPAARGRPDPQNRRFRVGQKIRYLKTQVYVGGLGGPGGPETGYLTLGLPETGYLSYPSMRITEVKTGRAGQPTSVEDETTDPLPFPAAVGRSGSSIVGFSKSAGFWT